MNRHCFHIRSLRLVVALLFFVVCAVAQASTSGKVVGVIDGDTIDVLVQGSMVRVRLAWIDAPERSQPFGHKSKQALSNLAFGKTATLNIVDRDRYGRSLGVVTVGAVQLNAEMVRLGFAWVYRQYSREANLLHLEADARDKRRGLWSDPDPIPPWDFRRQKRSPVLL